MSPHRHQPDTSQAASRRPPAADSGSGSGSVISRLSLLDGFRLEWAGHQRDLPRSAQRVLALLALSGRPGRAGVAGQLWPEVNEKHALGSLRTVLHRIQVNCPDIVHSCGDHLELASCVRVDFSEVTSWALSALADRSGDADGDAEDPAALNVPPGAYRGALLPGWYDEWVLLEREQFYQLRMHALEEVATRLAGVGRYGEALYAAHSAVRAAPLRESAHRAVVRIHLAEGNITEAVRQYESFRDLLRSEVDAEPSPLMKSLLGGVRGACAASHPAPSATAAAR